jgi:hypothetical protein
MASANGLAPPPSFLGGCVPPGAARWAGTRPRSSKLRLWSSSRLETGGHTLTMPGPGASGQRYRPGQSGLTS